jgi:hypothetical protein
MSTAGDINHEWAVYGGINSWTMNWVGNNYTRNFFCSDPSIAPITSGGNCSDGTAGHLYSSNHYLLGDVYNGRIYLECPNHFQGPGQLAKYQYNSLTFGQYQIHTLGSLPITGWPNTNILCPEQGAGGPYWCPAGTMLRAYPEVYAPPASRLIHDLISPSAIYIHSYIQNSHNLGALITWPPSGLPTDAWYYCNCSDYPYNPGGMSIRWVDATILNFGGTWAGISPDIFFIDIRYGTNPDQYIRWWPGGHPNWNTPVEPSLPWGWGNSLPPANPAGPLGFQLGSVVDLSPCNGYPWTGASPPAPPAPGFEGTPKIGPTGLGWYPHLYWGGTGTPPFYGSILFRYQWCYPLRPETYNAWSHCFDINNYPPPGL